MEEEGGGNRRASGGSLRTRSQAAPDWTVHESVILVTEISAVERDWLNTLSSFQKWEIVSENCNALDVNRSLNQCRRKWDSLLADYNTINQWESKVRADWSYWSLDDDRRKQLELPENFDSELFRAIDDHVKARDAGCDTEPDTEPDNDPEAQPDDLLLNFVQQSGSKKQRRKVRSQKRNREESEKPRRRIKSEKIKSEKIKSEECSSEEKVDEKTMPEESSREEKEQMLAAKLRENAELINATLEGLMGEDVDYKLADLENVEAVQTDYTRRQGDNLIVCLGNLADTLHQLCNMVQEEC